MTCDNYLAMLETLPVEELSYGAAREHVTVCRECDRVTRVVIEREQNMLMAYGHISPSADATALSDSAATIARRRRTVRRYSTALGLVATVAVVAVVGVVGTNVAHRRVPRGMVHQEFALRCLSAARAVAVVRANINDRLPTKLEAREPEGVLLVDGTPQTLREVRSVLDDYDNRCFVKEPPRPDR